MKMNNYKILEDRPELTTEQIAAGMSFGMIQTKVTTPKTVSLNAFIIAGIGVAVIVSAVFIYRSFNTKAENKKEQPVINDTLKENTILINSDTVIVKENDIAEEKKETDTFNIQPKQDVKIIEEEPEIIEEIKRTRSLSFQRLSNADAQYAIEIKDSVYGPVNVSKGYGEWQDGFGDHLEANSAWFKFIIKKDTLLTFHIVPTLGTDDYDFALYKCVDKDCRPQIRNKPVRVCFSWNSSMNHNTGLSNSAKDTTFEGVFANGEKQGKTYAPALKVKPGETYYLMINNSMRMQKNQDPEGFMIYFYNYLPKRKANKYK